MALIRFCAASIQVLPSNPTLTKTLYLSSWAAAGDGPKMPPTASARAAIANTASFARLIMFASLGYEPLSGSLVVWL